MTRGRSAGREGPPAAWWDQPWLAGVFAGLLGGFLGLSLLKFSNPPIMEKFIEAPRDIWELVIFSAWPASWAHWMLAILVGGGLLVFRRQPGVPAWLPVIPALWLVWQFVSATHSIAPDLSSGALSEFVACVVCFYLGLFCLGRSKCVWPFWLGLAIPFALVLAEGFEQHFGGLEATRRYWYLYEYPKLKVIPPGMLEKVASNRIFSTLFYPNSLAGALLLLLPPILVAISRIRRMTVPARGFLAFIIVIASLACLFWSGSKGGWLLMLILGILFLLRLPFKHQHKIVLVMAILLLGLAGFFVKYAHFFQKGATSVGARFDYWEAAVRTCADRPLLGSGPGTFGVAYARIKRPESEATRVAHNDYLEQASDSGLPGFLFYTAFIVTGLIRGYPRMASAAPMNLGLATEGRGWTGMWWGLAPKAAAAPPSPLPSPEGRGRIDGLDSSRECPSRGSMREFLGKTLARNWLRFAAWLGVLGWSLQSLMEFDLYIPALAWPALTILGWLVAENAAEICSTSPHTPA